MAGPEVKQLLLQVDATVELLRRNLISGQAQVDRFTSETQRRLDAADRRFGEFGRPLAGMRTSIDATRREIATIGTSVEQVENRIRASAGGIKAALLGSASGLAAAFSADRIKDYADGYTRYTNQLKVAGLEGNNLAKTQNDLFAVAQRNGVELEAVGTLYGKASAAAKELGASNADLLRFTSGVSAALRVQGGSTEAASGALQQLGQLLGSTRVQAEEFNSVADGARPILQAVANNLDGAGGSISKLKGLVNDGKVSNTDFFRAFLKGSTDLEAQAAKANLTIAASFTILNNALGKYIGETDAGLSATARVSSAIITMSQNLDTLIPVLAIVGTGFATRFVAGPIAAVTAEVLLLTKALDAEKLVMVGGKVAAAQKAEFVAASARTEVAQIEATIAARKAEQAALIEQIGAERALAAERRAAAVNYAAQNTSGGNRTVLLAAQRKAENDAAFATDRLTLARQRLVVVDGELAVAEGAIVGAQARAATATTAATAATNAATLSSRAAAAASKLFAGGLTLIGGSVAGGAAVLAVGALVGAIMLYRNASAAAEERNRATVVAMRETADASTRLNQKMAELAQIGHAAANGIAQAGASAATSTGKMLTFAGAVGEAASKLQQLAVARRREEILGYKSDYLDAKKRADEAQARINERNNAATSTRAEGGGIRVLSRIDQQRNREDAKIVAANRANQIASYRSAQQAAQVPLELRIRESDRNGGRDIDGELARVTRDLVVARQRGIRGQTEALEVQKFELTQYKAYRKQGLSAQAAQEAASRDAGSFRTASAGAQGDRDARTGRRTAAAADRQAAAAQRREAAQVRDAAADERAYSAAERQANNDIAAARADLTNSAVERAAIEKARIEAERVNRNNEIAQQVKQGSLGEGVQAQTRALELQRLNDQRAALETDVLTAREKQRMADEALTIAQADRANQTDLLGKQADLVTTAAERRDLELKILAIQYEEERARLDGVIASRDTTEAEKEVARRRRAMLGDLQKADEQSVEQKNEGPLDQYRRRLRESTTDMNTALQGVAVDGLDQLESGLLGIVNGTESVSSAFKRMAASILADLARIAIQKAVLSAIGGGGFFGLRTGGKIEGRATGGRISGPGTGTSDSILALVDGRKPLMVSNGESVVTAKATAEYWPIIDAMNKGTLQKLAGGGIVGGTPAATIRPVSVPRLDSLNTRSQTRVAVVGEIKVSPTREFDARMEGLAFRTVGAAAEPIMAGAEMRTVQNLRRPTLPGAPG